MFRRRREYVYREQAPVRDDAGRRPLGLWRWRYQLAPFYAVLSLAAAVFAGRWTDREAAWVTAAVVVLVLAGFACRRRTGAERSVIGVTALSALGWVAWMLWRVPDPWVGTAPWFLLAAIPPAALWWDHYAVRHAIKAQKVRDSWGPWSRRAGIAGTKLRDVLVSAWGWTATLAHRGRTFDDIKKGEALLEGEMGLDDDGVTIERTGKAAVARITVVERDPHAEPVKVTDLPALSTSPFAAIPIGPHTDGEIANVTLATERGERHVLAAGATDSGKTSLFNRLVQGSVVADDTVNLFVDLKHGQAARPWAPSMGLVISTVPDFRALIEDLLREAEWRGNVVQGNAWVPKRDGAPRIRVWVDEFAEAAGDYRLVQGVESGLRRFRSLGIGWGLATQVSKNDGAGSSTIKGQCSIRACGRMEERSHAKHVLRNASEVDATAIPQSRPGSLYIEAEGVRRGALVRCGWLSREDIEAFAREWADKQPALSSLIGRAVDLGMVVPTREATVEEQRGGRFDRLAEEMRAAATGPRMRAVSISAANAEVGRGEEIPDQAGDTAVDARILDLAESAGEVGLQISDVPEGPGMSRSTIGRRFGVLTRAGRLRCEGRGRATRYFAARERVSA